MPNNLDVQRIIQHRQELLENSNILLMKYRALKEENKNLKKELENEQLRSSKTILETRET